MTDSEAAEIPAETAPTAPAPPRWLTVLGRRPFLVLALLGLALWLPGILSLPPLDRDESRFAQSSRQMVESGNWVDIRFGQVPRYKKPAGIYWLQAASTELAGLFSGNMGRDDQIWTYRLPSLLGAIAASWLTVWCALAVAGSEAALLAGLLMMGSVLLTAEATIATTDAVLLACVLGVQGVLLRLYHAAHDPEAPRPLTRTVMLGWAAFAFGVLVKGPVVLGVAAATVIGLAAWDWWDRRKAGGQDRIWNWLNGLQLVRGLALTLLLILPWLIAITIQSQGAFFEESLGNDFAGKIAGGQESHGGWPGYFLLASALSFWPAILFVLPGIALGAARRAEPGIRFLLVWAAGWWLVVEAVPTKLPHYVLPAYPALTILAAMFVLDPHPARFLTTARWIAIAQFAVGTAFLTAAIILAPLYLGEGMWWPWLVAAGTGAMLALAALILAIRQKSLPAALLGLAALLVFVPALTVGVGPRLDQLWITQRLKPMVEAATRPGDPPPALAGYEEPSMLFALGKDVVLTDGKGAAEASAKSGGLALVEDSEQGDFLARLAELQADTQPVGELSGINYSRGKREHVTLYRVAQLRELN
jgi:4-amino-4-deoxy-L-arabinose transferase-like glycosyltransferase